MKYFDGSLPLTKYYRMDMSTGYAATCIDRDKISFPLLCMWTPNILMLLFEVKQVDKTKGLHYNITFASVKSCSYRE